MSIRYAAVYADRAQQPDDQEALDALHDQGLPRDPALIAHIDPTGPEDDDGGPATYIGWEITLTDPYLEAIVAAYNRLQPPDVDTAPLWAVRNNRTLEDLLEALAKARAREIGCPRCGGHLVVRTSDGLAPCWHPYHGPDGAQPIRRA